MTTDRPQPAARSPYDRDPEALAWARAKVQPYIDQLAEWEKQAEERGATAKARGIGVARLLAIRHFANGKGCTIGAFDERRPELAKAIDNALNAPTDHKENQAR